MLLTLLGVRGSTPAPGKDFVTFGGHTSCIAVTQNGTPAPVLVLDAGTGLRALTPLLKGEAYRGSLLLSHLHWDHMQGIPFFTAGDRDDASVDVYVPAQDGRNGEELLAQAMQPPSFPITPGGLRGRWTFTALEPGTRQIESFHVTCAEVRHKGGRTFGYRVSDGAVDLAYLPDHVAAGPSTPELETLIGGVDVLIHDAQFLEPERALADAYGHSTVEDSITIATRYAAKALVLFHYAPQRTDAELLSIKEQINASFPVLLAREGDEIDVASLVASGSHEA